MTDDNTGGTSGSSTSSTTLVAVAPAKVNLALHVTGRRGDGYHELDTVFVPLSLSDEVVVTIEPGDRRARGRGTDRARNGDDDPGQPMVSCCCPGFAELGGAGNLAARAARAYLARAELGEVEVAITLRKRIWVGAGLGGGSSDAAAVLRLLEQRFGLLGAQALAELALELGADVPFFLDPRPARGRGLGQLLEPLAGVPPLQLLLVNPGVSLATADVFGRLALPRDQRQGTGIDEQQLAALDGTLGPVLALLHNDLLAPATALCSTISDLFAALRGAGARGVGLSGSGPTVFGLFETAADACRARAKTDETARVFTAVAQTPASLTPRGRSPI